MENKEVLNKLFTYRDGMLFWKSKPHVGSIGDRAGGVLWGNTYRRIKINQRTYMEHRVIWVMHNGDIPDCFDIDHADTVRDNNRIENLRLATRSQNLMNSGAKNRNTSGYKGVSWHKRDKTWWATIRKDNKPIFLGYFKSPELAFEAYKKAANELHGEFANY